MAFHRSQRVAEEIKRELATIIRDGLKDPRVGFVTITSVEATRDLRYAKVYVSTMGKGEQAKETLAALRRAQGFLRTELGRTLSLRYVPELVFEFDESLEHGTKIMELLHQVQKEERSTSVEKESSVDEQP